ncbi:MAG: hypothetical protein JKY51_05790 [Opitutaceae bacterium]|nr:hypothetical protein [Opitutaceae bacterium]
MFLIEYTDGNFVNGEDVQWISIKAKKIQFTTRGDTENAFTVSEPMQASFLNNLQALNSNISNIESGARKVEEIFEGTSEALNKL